MLKLRAKTSSVDCLKLDFAYFYNAFYLLPMRACSPSKVFAANTLANPLTSARDNGSLGFGPAAAASTRTVVAERKTGAIYASLLRRRKGNGEE